MGKIEDRVYALFQKVRQLLTTDDDVLLGICALVSRKSGVPVIAYRLIVLACLCFWPWVTALVYVVLGLFLQEDSST